MTATRPNLFLRPDTLFGVCEGLGEETGLPPMLFRLAFAVPLIFAPAAVLAVYAAVGLALMILRRLAPAPAPAEQQAAPPRALPVAAPAGNDDVALPLAA